MKEFGLRIPVPLVNSGKYRYKRRKDGFGEGFATKETPFDEAVYLEWQIGYDTTEKDHQSGEKKTSLDDIHFIGANGKRKHPFELSEYLYGLVKKGVLNPSVFGELRARIQAYKELISDRKIKARHNPNPVEINKIPFQEAAVELPTFYYKTSKKCTIEVSIQKQQYASGVQPMLYFCIPLESLEEYKQILDRPAEKGETVTFAIRNEEDARCILDLVLVFGMCSENHRHDILSILDGLEKKFRSRKS